MEFLLENWPSRGGSREQNSDNNRLRTTPIHHLDFAMDYARLRVELVEACASVGLGFPSPTEQSQTQPVLVKSFADLRTLPALAGGNVGPAAVGAEART